jgi:acyl-CoA reductase-like NAD-dependent aldehyde dehydrogenase
MTETLTHFIGGKQISAPGALESTNPSNTGEIIAKFPDGGAEDVNKAVEAARSAFPGWAGSTPEVRADLLDKVGSMIIERKDALGKLLASEEGKTLPEATGETVRAGRIFKYFAGEALRRHGQNLDSVRPGVEIQTYREAVGVYGMITPWNFPIAIPAWKIAPALAYGNCVVMKPAELVPGSAWALADILHRAGIPAGVFNLVMGRGSVVGAALVKDARVDGISFTGSVPTGRGILAEAATRGAKVQLEMGGKNPMVVLNDADLDLAVRVSLDGAFFATGQRCTASSRLIVEDGIYDKFVGALAEAVGKLVVDDARKPGTNIGPVVDQGQLDQDLKYIGIGKEEGARLVIGGEQLERGTPGFYMAPAVFAEATNQMRISREEIFGPVASVIRAKNYDEALTLANDTPFGLCAGICTISLKHAAHFRRNIETGMVMVNLPTAGVDYHVPFGGRKGSSYGPREQGRYAVEFYTQVKTAYVNQAL